MLARWDGYEYNESKMEDEMKYQNILFATFIDRPNRFIAHVRLDGKVETVHVKNTGRCKEFLHEGVQVVLQKSDNPNRKTAYDLIAVKKERIGWINIDSQAPNVVAKEWLLSMGMEKIKPEYTFGKSRIDFYFEQNQMPCLMEVKGVTLERENIGYFPDAPTQRGTKHLQELIRAKEKGYMAYLAFVIQMEDIYEVRPNVLIDPQFTKAFEEAQSKGVEILFLPCKVTPETLVVRED